MPPMPSRSEVALYLAARASPARWFTNRELADTAGVNYRTTRLHTARLVRMHVFECERVFPGYRYRSAGIAIRRDNAEYRTRLDAAARVFGMK